MTRKASYAATTFGIDEVGLALEVDGMKERSIYMDLNAYWGRFRDPSNSVQKVYQHNRAGFENIIGTV